jgi:hypothetical protein
MSARLVSRSEMPAVSPSYRRDVAGYTSLRAFVASWSEKIASNAFLAGELYTAEHGLTVSDTALMRDA